MRRPYRTGINSDIIIAAEIGGMRDDVGEPLYGPDQRAGDRGAARLVRPALPGRPAADQRSPAALLHPGDLGAADHLCLPVRADAVSDLRKTLTRTGHCQGQTPVRPASSSGTIRNAASVSPPKVCRFGAAGPWPTR